MEGVVVHRRVELSLHADGWELWEVGGRHMAAHAMNRAVEEAVNSGLAAGQVVKQVLPLFAKYKDVGALSGETTWKLHRVLEAIFGGEVDWSGEPRSRKDAENL